MRERAQSRRSIVSKSWMPSTQKKRPKNEKCAAHKLHHASVNNAQLDNWTCGMRFRFFADSTAEQQLACQSIAVSSWQQKLPADGCANETWIERIIEILCLSSWEFFISICPFPIHQLRSWVRLLNNNSASISRSLRVITFSNRISINFFTVANKAIWWKLEAIESSHFSRTFVDSSKCDEIKYYFDFLLDSWFDSSVLSLAFFSHSRNFTSMSHTNHILIDPDCFESVAVRFRFTLGARACSRSHHKHKSITQNN